MLMLAHGDLSRVSILPLRLLYGAGQSVCGTYSNAHID
jgi:hypothetical protein